MKTGDYVRCLWDNLGTGVVIATEPRYVVKLDQPKGCVMFGESLTKDSFEVIEPSPDGGP